MKKYSILFHGYKRDSVKDGLPSYSGIYVVYKCVYNSKNNTVSLKEILYVGQAKNIKERVKNHEKYDAFSSRLKKGEELCYSYAHVAENQLGIIENALVFSIKPILNENLKDSFSFPSSRFIVEGEIALFEYIDFTITASEV